MVFSRCTLYVIANNVWKNYINDGEDGAKESTTKKFNRENIPISTYRWVRAEKKKLFK